MILFIGVKKQIASHNAAAGNTSNYITHGLDERCRHAHKVSVNNDSPGSMKVTRATRDYGAPSASLVGIAAYNLPPCAASVRRCINGSLNLRTGRWFCMIKVQPHRVPTTITVIKKYVQTSPNLIIKVHGFLLFWRPNCITLTKMSQSCYYNHSVSVSTTHYMFLHEDPNYSESLPSYWESKHSPRCEEDILNPAPSYASTRQPIILQSGADKLAEWFTIEARRIFRKGA